MDEKQQQKEFQEEIIREQQERIKELESKIKEQPIPQDIEKWIEKHKFKTSEVDGSEAIFVSDLQTFLLPELQQLKEDNERLKKQLDDAFVEKHTSLAMQKQKTGLQWIEQAAEIESLKEEIRELKEINEGLRLSRNEYREAWENRYGKTT